MQSNPQPFNLDNIRQIDGLYCLNDLHRMSGGEKKHQPANFMRRNDTKRLITEIECSSDMRNTLNPAYKIIQGNYANDDMQGTYVCRELVYAYAMWISPAFFLVVIRVFDRVVTHIIPPTSPLTQRFNAVCLERDEVKGRLTVHGSQLSILGNQVLPSLEQEITQLLAQIQPQLPFHLDQIDQTGGNHDK